MRVLYVRISTVDQKTDRQKVQESEFDYIVEDKISGTVAFKDRPGGKEIMSLVERSIISELCVWQIDRLGRDLRDIMNSIHFFTENGVCINFINQGLRTLDQNGKENSISKLIISILGTVSEMERKQMRERQIQGIAIAKAKGVYKGRKKGSKEDILTFLNKPKNKKALKLLKQNYKNVEVSRIVGLHLNTVTKIKKLMSV